MNECVYRFMLTLHALDYCLHLTKQTFTFHKLTSAERREHEFPIHSQFAF